MAHNGPVERRYVNVQVRDWDDHACVLGRPPAHPHTLLDYLRRGPFCSRIPGLVLGGRAAMAEALDWDQDAFDTCFAELVTAGLVVADWKARVVYLPWVLGQDCNHCSPSIAVKWKRELLCAPDSALVGQCWAAIRARLDGLALASFDTYTHRYHPRNWDKSAYPAVYKRDGLACRYCGSRSQLTIDHVIPRIQGGGDSALNLVVCCITCNKRKNRRTPEQAGFSLRPIPRVERP